MQKQKWEQFLHHLISDFLKQQGIRKLFKCYFGPTFPVNGSSITARTKPLVSKFGTTDMG